MTTFDDLPDLSTNLDGGPQDTQIVADNVRAVEAIYFAAQLEEVGLLKVVDRLVESFAQGLLPLRPGPGAALLAEARDLSLSALTEWERRSLYTRVLGAPGGDPGDVAPNRTFPGLWLRFVSAVAQSGLQEQDAKQAGKDLALNLSLHGYGLAHTAARRLHDQFKVALAVLSSHDIQSAYGAHDLYGLAQHVARLDLGTTPDIPRAMTLANSGALIINWLATHATGPGDPASPPVEIGEMVVACEQWLSVSASSTSESFVCSDD